MCDFNRDLRRHALGYWASMYGYDYFEANEPGFWEAVAEYFTHN